MALSLSNTLLPFKHIHNILRSEKHILAPVLSHQNSNFRPPNPMNFTTKIPTTPQVTSKGSESLSSIITELENEHAGDDNTTKTQELESRLPNEWREIHGQNNWAGLLDPMDPLLRSELIRYGEMAQATYDSFDYDAFSKYCGSCRFNRRWFFDALEMTHLGYEVTRYLYATGNIKLPHFFLKSRWPKVWSNKANWMGYVAVSNDETSKRIGRRDITIAWRGTVTRLEWLSDLMDFLKQVKGSKIPCPDPDVKVEYGFLDLYTDKDDTCRFCKYSAREQILTEVKRLVEMYPNEELSITITGHSLGSALAVLSAYDILETGLNKTPDGRTVPVCVFSFSGPRVGNQKFKERIESLGAKVLRVVNVHDVVPKSPGFLFNEDVPRFLMRLVEDLPWCYSHVGVELELNHEHSPYLRDTPDPANAHNLEALLHLVDGYHGKGHKFASSSGRDPALVNKSSDFLKDEYLVPPNWRQFANKGLIRGKDGRWMQPERPKLDEHPEDMLHQLNKLGISSN